MAAKPKSLYDLVLIYSIGNVSTRIINFALVFVTTFYLTREDVGQYDLILITISLLTPLATLQLGDVALRWLLEDNSRQNVEKVISNISVMLVGGLSILGCGILVFQQVNPIEHLWLVYVLVCFQSIFLFIQQCSRGMGNNKLFAASGIIYTFLYALLTVGALRFLHLKVGGMLVANIIAVVSVNIFILLKTKLLQYFSWQHIHLATCREFIHYSVPLIPNSVSWWAISSLNRYIILMFMGVAANGLYAISYKIPTLLVVFNGIFNQAWQDKAIATNHTANGTAKFSSTLNTFLKIVLSIALVIIPFNRLLLPYLVSESFSEAWQYTPLILLGVVFSAYSGFFGSMYLREKKTKELFYSSLAGGVITTIVAYVSVPYIGLYGAGLSILTGYFLQFLVRAVAIHKIIPFQIQYPTLLLLLSLYGVGVACSFAEEKTIHIVSAVGILGVALLLNRKTLTQIKEI